MTFKGKKLTKKQIWKYVNLGISIFLVLLLLIGIGNNALHNPIFQLLAAFYVQFIFGYKVYVQTYKEWFKIHYLGMDTLMTVGTFIPFVYSFYLAVMELSGHPTGFEPFFSAGATIIIVVTIGDMVNTYFESHLHSQLSDLNNKKAVDANLFANGEIKVIPAKELKINDVVVVKKGETIPADGLLLSEHASIDESMFNGEMNYSDKKKNQIVYGGSINTSEPFKLQITKTYKDSMINQLIRKVQKTQGAKLNMSKTIDKIAQIFTPIILVLAITFFLLQYFLGNHLPDLLLMSHHVDWATDKVSIAIYYAVGVLVGACPCVFGIAIPIAIAVANGKFLKHGVLLNKGQSFDAIKKIKAIAFDKTGTITEGKFQINHIHGGKDYTKFFYSLSKLSNHPLSRSFVKKIETTMPDTPYLHVDNFQEVAGVGLVGNINGDEYKIVSNKYITENHLAIAIPDMCEANLPLVTYSYLVKNDEVVLEIQFIDQIKPNAYHAIAELRHMGYKLFLITGDSQLNADHLRKQLGFDGVYAKVLPEQKQDIIKEIQTKYDVAFVGDGLNDVAALQQANVSIAMNSGNSISKSISDFIILDDNLKSVVDAIKIINQANKSINLNLLWALFYNLLIIPLAGCGVIMPILAAVIMGCSDLVLTSNAFIFRMVKVKWKVGYPTKEWT